MVASRQSEKTKDVLNPASTSRLRCPWSPLKSTDGPEEDGGAVSRPEAGTTVDANADLSELV